LDHSYTAGGNVKWYKRFGIDWHFLKELNRELAYDQQFHSYVDTQENQKIYLHKNLYKMVTAALFIIAKKQKQPKCPLIDE